VAGARRRVTAAAPRMAGKGGAAPPAGAPAGEAVLSCAAYASSSVLLTLANKAVFSERRLDYPWMLLGLQSSIVTLLLGAYYAVRRRRFPVDPALLRMLALPCLFFTLFIYSNGPCPRSARAAAWPHGLRDRSVTDDSVFRPLQPERCATSACRS
jgi:hypothetical protein